MHWTKVSPDRLPDYSGKILKLGDYDEGEHYKQTDRDCWPSLIHQSPAAATPTPASSRDSITGKLWDLWDGVLCLLLTLVPQQFNIPVKSNDGDKQSAEYVMLRQDVSLLEIQNWIAKLWYTAELGWSDLIYLQGCDLMQFLCNFNCKLSRADKCTTLKVIADVQPCSNED